MADVVYFDGGIDLPFCPPTVNGIYISGSGCCSEFYSAFIGGNQTYNLTYTLPTASGTSGQVLTNDGNGNLSWTTVSGGGGGTGTITGTGTTNYLSKWSSSTGLTNSIVLETGSTIDISGALRVTASSGTATAVMGRDANGYVSNLSLGNGLSISGGTLSFTGSTGVSGNFVPYLGATGNTDLGGYGIAGSYFQLSTSTGGTLVPGMFSWNGSDGTADLMLKGGTVTLPIGETQLARVINETGANLLKSQYRVVRVNGSTGTRLKVALALASGDATSVETLGLVAENITLSQEGFVITSGLIKGINTTGSLQAETWSDGDMLFLSPFVAGALTNIKPQAPNHLVVMGYVVTAANNGVIYVKVDNGYELDELHNVLISSAATNEILAYDGVTGVWRNRTASSLNLVSGSGTTNRLLKWSSATGVTDSIILETGSTIDITGALRVTASSGTSTTLMGRDANGYVSNITTGAGLQLSNGTLSLTGATGTGTTGYVPRWVSSSGLTDSVIFSTGTVVGINTTAPLQTLDVRGTMRLTGSTGTGTTLMGRDANGDVSAITVGFGLSLSGNTLSTTGTTGVSGSGTATQVAFWGGNTTLSGSSNLYWDNVNKRLGINATTLNYDLTINKSGGNSAIEMASASSAGSEGGRNIFLFRSARNTLSSPSASANNDPIAEYIGAGYNGSAYVNNVSMSFYIDAGTISSSSLPSYVAFETTASGSIIRRQVFRILGNGNTIIQTGGVFVDNGQKLQVYGNALIRGSGTTTGTTFLLQNSGSTNTFAVLDNGQIGVNTATPNTSSIFQIDSTTLGFLPPRMSTTQKTGIASPAQGLVVYDTTMQALSAYNGSNWATVGGGEQMFTITGSTATINFNAGNIADITLATSTTLTLTGGTFGTFIIKLTQDATGGRVVSWPSNVRWSGGIPPSLTTTGGKVDVISLIFDGTNYYGTYALNF